MNGNPTDRPTTKRRTSNGLARIGCVGMVAMSMAASQAGAAIAVVGGVSNWVVNGATSLTRSYTVDPSAKVLVVQIALRNISTVPAFTWNGTPMNVAANKINPDNPRVIATYYLFDPTNGTFNLAGTWAGASISYSVGAFTLSGVDKNAAVLTGTYYAGPASHNDATATITGVAANSAAVTEQISNSDCLSGGGTVQLTNFTQTATGGTPQSLWLTTTDGNNTGSAGALITGLSAGSVTVAGTILPTGGANYLRTLLAATIFSPWSDTPGIANVAVSNITVTTAALYGNLSSTGASATAVSVFWGKTDQSPSTNGWDGSYSFGYTNVGPLVTTAAGLDSNTKYCFRYYATNAFGGVWATGNPTNFTTLSAAPVMQNQPVSNVTSAAANLNGFVVSTGASPVTVSVFWGTTDGGTNRANWAKTNTFTQGQWDRGTYPTYAAGSLTADTDYYYTYYGTNDAGEGWATNSQYFITGALNLSPSALLCGPSLPATATFTVTRPSGCTAGSLPVTYRLGGDAAPWVTASGNVTIPAGQASTTITVSVAGPVLYGAARKDFTLTLNEGPYAIGTAGAATGTVCGKQVIGYAGAKIWWDDGDGNSGTITSCVWGVGNTLDYATWDDIQAALNLAGNNPVTPGTVKLCGDFKRTADDATVGSLVVSNHNIALSGGWDTSFTTQSGRSMLNVNGSDTASNRFRVVDIWGTNVALANLVVTNGYMKNAFGDWVNNYGIGIFVRRPAVGTLLDNLVVAGNRGDTTFNSTYGGGIQIGEGGNYVGPSGTRVRNCQIVNNVVYGGGAGINISDAGATDNPVVIENCTVANNIAYGSAASSYACGGGIGLGDAISADANTASHVVIANCRIVQNQSAQYGAGIGLQGWTAYPRVELFGCLIASNYWLTGASQKAGNAIAVGTPGGDGNWSSSTGFGGLAYLVNCTVVDNTQPSQPAAASGFHVNPSPYDEGRLILINSITRSNELGFTDVRYGGGDYNTHNYTDFQNDTVSEARYVEIDPQESNVTNTTFAGAISTNGNVTPAFRTLTTNGVLSQAIQQNFDGDPGFRGSGSDPYLLTSASANALNNAVTKTDSRGFGYVDVDLNGAYTTNVDIIVAGTPPGGNHLVYATDILGNPRVAAGGMDRGAYELPPPKGTVVFLQ